MLGDNLEYLTRSLKLESLAIHRTSDAAALAAAPGPVDAAAAYPGCPVAAFRAVPQQPQQ